MAIINIPSKFKELLDKDQSLNGVVNTTLSLFGEILEDNKLYFFEEYTDHGIKHIESVLRSSAMLVTENTFKNVLKPTDVGYYTLSVILHDIGMHLGLDGFNALLRGDFDDVMVAELDTKTWKELWDEYYGEARRFSGKQLKNIFGKEDEIVDMPPFDDEGEIKSKHKKLVGEFIRRHHPRLAHEIALKGFPGKDEPLIFAKDLGLKYRNLIGLIARSHGMDLRKCADYLESEYGKDRRRIVYDCHAIFMMVLLRVGDYIQVNKRTSKVLLKLKTFSSPFSEYEHIKDLDIEEVHFKYQDDPERIYIVAEPRDSIVYLKLNELVKGIQYELDFSWAVLGELYGTIEEKPEIKYRRIKSNLEDRQFKSRQNYIPDSFTFRANDEITKLLIAPLYGDDPTFGVRELLQNAIDACREKELIEKNKGSKYIPIIKVDIYQEGGKSYFQIVDNGIGMDLNVIKSYFLSAGASFRKSMDWQKKFEDDKGNSAVQRSGRFGVGILAAFLIGETIEVKTKKINAEGFYFEADLNSEQINILKMPVSEGTSIRMEIDKAVYEYFSFIYNKDWRKWYVFNKPKVLYRVDGKSLHAYKKYDPNETDDIPLDWNVFYPKGYDKILWSYNKYSGVYLTCNGIVINADRNNYDDHDYMGEAFEILRCPNLSIIDRNGVLPLSLDRSRLTKKPDFTEGLIEDVYKDFISYLLVNTDINNCIENNIIDGGIKMLSYPGFGDYYWQNNYQYGGGLYKKYSSQYSQLLKTPLLNKEGFVLNYSYFISKVGKVDFLYIQNDDNNKLEIEVDDYFYSIAQMPINSINDFRAAIEGVDGSPYYNSRSYIKTEKYKFLFSEVKYRFPQYLHEISKLVYQDNDWSIIELGIPPKRVVSNAFLKSNKGVNYVREHIIDLAAYKDREKGGDPVFNRLLEKYLGDDVIIPYDLEERKKKYPLAFQELERYMRKYLE